jgi:hypothetical protein
MTLEELASKLARVGETRRIAEAELEALRSREERARELEADRDALVASYAETVPEALDDLSGERRSMVYEDATVGGHTRPGGLRGQRGAL